MESLVALNRSEQAVCTPASPHASIGKTYWRRH